MADSVLRFRDDLQCLYTFRKTIQTYGLDQSTAMVLHKSHLLSGTSFSNLGLESLGYDTASEIALESITEAIKHTVTKWAAKVLSFISRSVAKLVGGLKSLGLKIAKASKAIGAHGWDETKKASQYVTAHPVKTVLGVSTAVIAAIGVIAYANGSFPSFSAGSDAFRKFGETLATKINSIKWPLGTLKAEAVEGELRVALTPIREVVTKPVDITIEAAGWTESTTASLIKQTQEGIKSFGDNLTAFQARQAKNVPNISDLIGRSTKATEAFGHDDEDWSDFKDKVVKGLTISYYICKAIVFIAAMVIMKGLSLIWSVIKFLMPIDGSMYHSY